MTKFLNTVSGPKVDVSNIIVTPVIKNADVAPQPEATPSSIDMGELNNGSAIVISSPTSITLDAINVSASSEYTPTLDKDLVTKDYTDLLSNATYHALAELDNEKQALLVSGTNIKTVNGTSVLGSGNITTPDTTYSEITTAEITAGTSTTARAITGRRSQEIVNKARTGLVEGNANASNIVSNIFIGTQAEYDALPDKTGILAIIEE